MRAQEHSVDKFVPVTTLGSHSKRGRFFHATTGRRRGWDEGPAARDKADTANRPQCRPSTLPSLYQRREVDRPCDFGLLFGAVDRHCTSLVLWGVSSDGPERGTTNPGHGSGGFGEAVYNADTEQGYRVEGKLPSCQRRFESCTPRYQQMRLETRRQPTNQCSEEFKLRRRPQVRHQSKSQRVDDNALPACYGARLGAG